MKPHLVSKSYNFPEGRSLENTCIAFIELSGGFDYRDIYAYCEKEGYKKPEIYIDCIDGAKNIEQGADQADGEICLDVCVAAGVAQGVKILVILTPNSNKGFVDAINHAVNHTLKPCAISISWGGPDIYTGTDYRTSYG